ncbi:hypothetical protein TYRP_006207 [Tyrophagus putrescentiae]|nr:hypothetical protein TYRP_006207 [Tyrophagus putrescentiae]
MPEIMLKGRESVSFDPAPEMADCAQLLPPVLLAAERVLCPPTLEPLALESTEKPPALEPMEEPSLDLEAEIGGGCFASSLEATFERGFGSAEAEKVAAAPMPEAGASATAEGGRGFFLATFEGTFGSAKAEGVAAAPVPEAGALATAEVGGGCFASSLEATFEGGFSLSTFESGFSSAIFEGTSARPSRGVAAAPVPEAGALAKAEVGRWLLAPLGGHFFRALFSATFEEGVRQAIRAGALATAEVGGGCFASSLEATFKGGLFFRTLKVASLWPF